MNKFKCLDCRKEFVKVDMYEDAGICADCAKCRQFERLPLPIPVRHGHMVAYINPMSPDYLNFLLCNVHYLQGLAKEIEMFRSYFWENEEMEWFEAVEDTRKYVEAFFKDTQYLRCAYVENEVKS
jgi:hypothetical protein